MAVPPLASAEEGGLLAGVYNAIVPRHVRRRMASRPPPTPKQVLTTMLGWLEWPYFPGALVDWKRYPELVWDDMVAGITVGVVLVPQGMAYALTASLPPIMGLYAGTIAGYAYALLGTSGQLTVGPVALVSTFMTGTFRSLGISLDKKNVVATFVRTHVAAVLSLAVGVMLVVMGALRLGRLMKFVSPSVMIGFTTGSGVYIGLSQMKYLFGVKLSERKYYWELYMELWDLVVHESNREVMKVGFSCYAVMLFFFVLKKAVGARLSKEQRRSRWFKALLFGMSSSTLSVLILATVATRQLHKNGVTIPIVGEVPKGFNPFMLPKINHFGLSFGTVMVRAVPLMLLCYMESVAVARKYAIIHGYNVDTNQEMWALGMGCICASFFSAYPPGGSFSRTALQADLGAKTPICNVFTGLLVTIVITSMTDLLFYVPMAFLGAVIDIAVLNLLEFHEMWKALWIAPVDFLVMVFTFVVTAFYNTELGLEYGILASVVVLVWQISSLDVATVGMLRNAGDAHTIFADVERYPEAKLHRGIRVLRLTANLFFGNVSVFRDEFYDLILTSASGIRTVIVDAHGVSDLDLTTLSVFHDLLDHAQRSDITVYFANVSERLIFYMEGYDLIDRIGGIKLIQEPLARVYQHACDTLGVKDSPYPLVPSSQRPRADSNLSAGGGMP